MATTRKEFVLKKVAAEQPARQTMMVARLMPVWNSERAATTNVDLNRYQGLEMFSEQAPVVEEDEEKGLEKVRQDEELTKLDGKRRGTSVNRIGMREMRWVLRDATRRKAEKRAMKEAEAKGQRPPHDVHKEPLLRSGGLQLLGRREGLIKESSSSAAAAATGGSKKSTSSSSSSTAGSGEGVDGISARYAIMMQTGDNEISLAPLGAWLTFRPLKIEKWAPVSQSSAAAAASEGAASAGGAPSSGVELGRKASALLADVAAATKSFSSSSSSSSTGGKGFALSSSAKRNVLLSKLRSDNEQRAALDPSVEKESRDAKKNKSGRGKGAGSSGSKSGGWDGFDDMSGALAEGHGGLELLDSLAQGHGGGDGDGGDDVAVDADGRAEGIASDDEAGSEGRDDTRAYDANNEKIVLSSSESESEGGSDDDGDKEEDSEAKQKRDKELLAKLKSEKGRYGKRGKNGDGNSSDDASDHESGGAIGKSKSRSVQMLQARAQQAAAAGGSGGGLKRKGRGDDDSDDDDEDGGTGGGKRLATGPAGKSPGAGVSNHRAQSTAGSAGSSSSTGASQSASASASGGGSISEREVRAVLEQANGRMKTVDLKNRFKKRIKASDLARKEFIAVLQHLVVIEEDEVEGRMYVLKGRQFS